MSDKVMVERELLEDLRDCANECYNHARMRGTSGLDNYERLTDQADLALESPATSAWVKIANQKPEKGEDVLVWCYDTKEQFVAFSLGDSRFQFAVDKVGNAIVCRPTHWMPLPKAPKVRS